MGKINKNSIIILTTFVIIITSLLFFGLGYLMHNTTAIETIYKTNYIKPGNATIIVYYYPSAGYNLYSVLIKGENLSLAINYNLYQPTPNSIVQNNIAESTNIISNALNTNIIPISFPHSKYATAFTQLMPFSYYNVTIRYTYAPPCNGICPEISNNFIMAGSESEIIKTGADNSVVIVYFKTGPGIRQ